MSSKVDRIELVRLFVRIADTSSLSAAGRSLGLSQPSSSRQLKPLETMLGTQLVQRSTHDLVLTNAGEQFLPIAIELLNLWDGAAEAARLSRDEYRGPIRIAVPVAIGQTILADLAAGGYDLWIRAGPIRDQTLIVHELRRTDRAIVGHASEARVAHPAELNSRDAVQLTTFMTRQIPLETKDGRNATLRLKPAFVTDNLYAALAAIKKGVGYGIMPYWAINDELKSGTLIELCAEWKPPAITLHVAYPQARFRPARVKIFIDYLRNQALRTDASVKPQLVR